MSNILIVVLIYVLVHGTDYLFYMKQKEAYNYVSRRTYALYIVGQIALISTFWAYYKAFFEHIADELAALAILLGVLLFFTYQLVREQLLVCHVTSRTERCLTPKYVLIKGSEIVFQQLCYLAIALFLVEQVGYNILTFLAFLLILLIMHVPVVLSCTTHVSKHLTFGIAIISAPILYIYIELGYFFPAVYLHTLLYVFYWVAFADFNPDFSKTVDN